MNSGALISTDQKYRYSLWRMWDETKPTVMFIMLNPSTADAENDDPTIRKCIAYAKQWGYGSIVVHNLFNYRTPNKYEILRKDVEPVGVRILANSLMLLDAHKCDKVICAWGNGEYILTQFRAKDVLRSLIGSISQEKICCLKVNKSLMPAHPLYLSGSLEPRQYWELHGVLGGEK